MASIEIKLPGFRFHPTEEELLDFYLRNVVLGKKLNFNIIGYLDIYRYNPWELPGLAQIGEREWYFFVPRDRKTGNGGRPNRTTEHGFWKATGSDRAIRSAAEPRRLMGLKKTLVFYQGRAPRGTRTDWVMNEYRLPDNINTSQKEDIVLCKIYRKATSLKELEQRAAMEEDSKALNGSMSIAADNNSSSNSDQDWLNPSPSSVPVDCAVANREFPKEMEVTSKSIIWPVMAFPELQVPTSGLEFPKEVEITSKSIIRPAVALPELQVPMSGLEWMQDPFLTQLRSPWLDQWSPYASLLNF